MVLLTAACLLVGALGGHVFDTVLIELFIAVAVVVAAVTATRAHATWARAPVVAAVIVAATVAAAVMADGSIADGFPGAVRGPQRLLSTEWPSPVEPSMVAAVALLLAATTAAALLAAEQLRWHLLPLLPVVVSSTVLVALAAPAPPASSVVLALAAVAIGVAATGGGSSRATGAPMLVSVAAVAVIGVGVSAVVEVPDRADPRRTEPAVVTAAVLDPLEAVAALRTAQPGTDLMTIEDRSPLTPPGIPARWRVSAFDTYDGQRWTPTVDLRPIGGRLAAPAEPGALPTTASPLRYEVRYHGDLIDLVPVPGVPLEVDQDVETDIERVAVRLRARPDDTTRIAVEALPPATLGEATAVGVMTREVDELSAGFTERARALAGDGAVLEQLGRLARVMRTEWQRDSRAPGGGQQVALIDRFVTETRRGTAEQFVTGYVLLARALGVDARVAVGYVVPPEQLGGRFTIRTEHAAAWPEVRLQDGRWLAVDPVPLTEATDDDEPPPPPEAQTPAAAQPPIAPPVDDLDRDDDVVGESDGRADGLGSIGVWLVRGSLVTGLVLGPVALALVAVLLVKWRRRRGRVRAADPADQVRGYWATATDALVDAGLTIPAAWTDHTIAEAAERVTGTPSHEARRLAAMSSTVTFGSPAPDDARLLVADAAASCAAIDGAIRSSRTRWERARWRCSLRSLRRATRSPVVP